MRRHPERRLINIVANREFHAPPDAVHRDKIPSRLLEVVEIQIIDIFGGVIHLAVHFHAVMAENRCPAICLFAVFSVDETKRRRLFKGQRERRKRGFPIRLAMFSESRIEEFIRVDGHSFVFIARADGVFVRKRTKPTAKIGAFQRHIRQITDLVHLDGIAECTT